MMQKPWFKLVIWILATSFFFMASGILISSLGPSASEEQVMLYVQGMMDAMHNSLMGLSMTIEQDAVLKDLIYKVSLITFPLMATSAVLGMYVRSARGKKDVR